MRAALAFALAPLGSPPASAQEQVAIHGAGGLAFGVTDGPNAYLAGTPDRSWDLRDLSLTVLATPSERLLVGGQVYWGVRNIFRPDELELNLNLVFAQYKVSDALKLRAGVSRQPFGIYSETLEIGNLRPFFALPRGVYSPGTFQTEGYRGLGLTGTLAGASRWLVEYDVYGGVVVLSSPTVINPVFEDLAPGQEGDQELNDVIGGRVRVRTPVDGLSVGVSYYTGSPESPLFGLPRERQHAYLGSFEFVRDRAALRSEYAYRDTGNGASATAAYVEGVYRPLRRWEIAARWDWFDGELGPLIPLPAFVSPVLDHRDLALGINCRVTDGLVFKASIHAVDGNLLAAPPEGVDFGVGGSLDRKTRLLQLGAQFAF
jgi:hypothetical protein